MPYLIRLTYASISTSDISNFRHELIDIVDTSKQHNYMQEIYGVIYYGNGYFFQCLEGQKTKVDNLFNEIKKDKRHSNILKLSYSRIKNPIFKDWNMKFTGLELNFETRLKSFFEYHGWNSFNPYLLDANLLDDFIKILLKQEEAIIKLYRDNYIIPDMDKDIFMGEINKFIIFLFVLLILFYFIYIFISKSENYMSYGKNEIYFPENCDKREIFLDH